MREISKSERLFEISNKARSRASGLELVGVQPRCGGDESAEARIRYLLESVVAVEIRLRTKRRGVDAFVPLFSRSQGPAMIRIARPCRRCV